MRNNTCIPWVGSEKETLDDLRKRAEERRLKRAAKRKSGKQGLHMTALEISRAKEKIFSEYIRAPKDQKPTMREIAEKHGFCVNTINKWFRARGFAPQRRTP